MGEKTRRIVEFTQEKGVTEQIQDAYVYAGRKEIRISLLTSSPTFSSQMEIYKVIRSWTTAMSLILTFLCNTL